MRLSAGWGIKWGALCCRRLSCLITHIRCNQIRVHHSLSLTSICSVPLYTQKLWCHTALLDRPRTLAVRSARRFPPPLPPSRQPLADAATPLQASLGSHTRLNSTVARHEPNPTMESTRSQASSVAFLTSGMDRTGECPWQHGCYPSKVDLDLLNPAGGHKAGGSWRDGWCAALMMMVAVMMALMMVEGRSGTYHSLLPVLDQDM